MGQQAEFSERLMLDQAEQVLRGIATRLKEPLAFVAEPAAPNRRLRIDASVSLGQNRFALECKWASDSASVIGAISGLSRWHQAEGEGRPLLCVSHMGPAGRRICEEAGISWFDLSGNADITGHGLHIHVEGHKNRFQRRGRPGGFFAPKASRIARCLLIAHPEPMSYRDILKRTRLGKGYVSRVLPQMVAAGLLAEHASQSFRVLDPAHLLAAWTDVYDFDKHTRLAGMIPPAPGPANLVRVVNTLLEEKLQVAATGLAAAWALRQHAEFRLTTVYVDRLPSADVLERMGFREEARGSNLWLVVPSDPGVFDGAARIDGVDCVHPVQVLLDLARQPERAPEAKEDLRRWLLSQWKPT